MTALLYTLATIGAIHVLWTLWRYVCIKFDRSFPFFQRYGPIELPGYTPRPDHENLAAIAIGMATKQRYENPSDDELAEALLIIHKAEVVVLSPEHRRAYRPRGLPPNR